MLLVGFCLALTWWMREGSVLEAEFNTLVLKVNSSPIPFRVYRFRHGHEPLYLYYHLEDGANADRTSGCLQDYSPLSPTSPIRR
jgi:hypothetical protein